MGRKFRGFQLRIHKFDASVTLVCCALLGFFGWHATEGPRGFDYTVKLGKQAEVLEQQLAKATAQREALESQVVLMRPDNIDPDMLDEQVRKVLFLARANELVVLNPR